MSSTLCGKILVFLSVDSRLVRAASNVATSPPLITVKCPIGHDSSHQPGLASEMAPSSFCSLVPSPKLHPKGQADRATQPPSHSRSASWVSLPRSPSLILTLPRRQLVPTWLSVGTGEPATNPETKQDPFAISQPGFFQGGSVIGMLRGEMLV